MRKNCVLGPMISLFFEVYNLLFLSPWACATFVN